MKQHIRYGNKNEDGTVTWGDWQTSELDNNTTMLTVIGMTPNYYKRQSLFGSDKTTVTVYANTQINIGGKGYISQVDTVLDVTALGSADERAGKDVYIYACQGSGSEPVFVLSMNSTVPDGYTADNSRKIGGFHCLCNSVGTISGHTYSGLNTGDVIDISAWDLLHRANSENEGMVWIAGLGKWYDIYLTSYNGTELASEYGAEICNGYSTEPFHGDKYAEYAGLIGKKLTSRDEFVVYAKGSNECTNISGGASGVTAGGHVDTNNRRMISNYALEECCGHFYQWLTDCFGGKNADYPSSLTTETAYRHGGARPGEYWYLDVYRWDDPNTSPTQSPQSNNGVAYSRLYHADVDGDNVNAFGDSYGVVARFRAGGAWGDGSACGSRCVHLCSLSARATSDGGCRLASEPRIVVL